MAAAVLNMSDVLVLLFITLLNTVTTMISNVTYWTDTELKLDSELGMVRSSNY